MNSELDLSQIAYLEATPAPRPQAVRSALAEGGYLLSHPSPLMPAPPALGLAKHGLLLAIANRSADHSPMLRQRASTSNNSGEMRHISWAQAWQQIQHIASALLAAGFGAHTPIATLSGNSIEQAILRWAALMVGVPLVHVSPSYSTVSQDFANIRSIWADCAALHCPAAVFVQSRAPFARALDCVASLGTARVIDVAQDWANWLATPVNTSAIAAAQAKLNDASPVAVYFTSGSTGTPKGVVQTRGMLAAQQMLARTLYFPETRGPVQIVDWLPWHHVFGGVANLARLLELGGTYTIDEGRPMGAQFDATLKNLRDTPPTFYSSTPLAFARLAPALEADPALAAAFFSRLEFMGYGGASLPAESWARMQRLAVQHRGGKLPFLSGFGTTESAATGLALYWPSDEPAVIGLPFPGVALKLVPLDGQAAGDAQGRFEMRMCGPHMFAGYLNRPDLNTSVFDEDGYYRLGDAVRFVDAANPLKGLRFAGRVAENFKLASGTWVNAGALRLQAISTLSPLITDCIVCGRDLDDVAVLGWANEAKLRELDSSLAALPLAQLIAHPIVVAALSAKLRAAPNTGNAATVQRAMLLATPPTLDSGEMTDKGYVNQGVATLRRAAEIAVLYAGTPNAVVAVR